MMILFAKLTKGIGHKFYQLMKSSPIMVRLNRLMGFSRPLLITGSPTTKCIYRQTIKILHRYVSTQKEHILSQK
jgi:hypothetical protein